ncbi:hypothetical protein [Pseudomonas sp. PAMC 26793]|nr:hypothetical protein [Pseudomonas sp. PAMC 26793]
MKLIIVIAVAVLCTGCQYFSYQDSCRDNPDQPSCAGMSSQEASIHRR